MAIEDKKYNSIHGKTGSNKDSMKAKFDDNMHSVAVDFPDDWPELSAVIYQIGQLEEELDYLRSIIDANNDKTTFPGIGTSGSTCLAGNTTTITTSQANAITANTKKTGITTSQADAITANTAKTGITDSQAEAITANTEKVSFPLSAEEGNSLSFTINGANLTIANAYTDPKTGKTISYSTTLTLK